MGLTDSEQLKSRENYEFNSPMFEMRISSLPSKEFAAKFDIWISSMLPFPLELLNIHIGDKF